MFEDRMFFVKDLGLRELLASICLDTDTGIKVDDVLTLPFTSEGVRVLPPSLLLKFDHLFIASGMWSLYVTQVCSNRKILADAPDLLQAATALISAMSSHPQFAIEVVQMLALDCIEEFDPAESLHTLTKNWKLDALQDTIENLAAKFQGWLPSVASLSRLSSIGSNPSQEKGGGAPTSSELQREPSSSAESIGESIRSPRERLVSNDDPYILLQDSAVKQRARIERHERVINLGTLTIRLENILRESTAASQRQLETNLSKLRAQLELGCERFSQELAQIRAKQQEQEARFESTKSTVHAKLTSELEDLQRFKQNTAQERFELEKQLSALRQEVLQKETELEQLSQKESRLSELCCRISHEMDALNLPFQDFSGSSLAAIQEGQHLLDHLQTLLTLIPSCSSTVGENAAPVHSPSMPSPSQKSPQKVLDEVMHLINEYMTDAIPQYYATEQEFIKLGCDRLKSQSPSSRGGSIYRPALAQTSVYLDRQAKYVENALRELSLLSSDSKSEYDAALKHAYMGCRQLLKSNHQLIFS
eukprot:Protomagalhaensia_sp_Gyna_25__4803@NODE_489_length_3285_cov_6_870302_g380_i0_p1_GENE_NODE_489_length_3285_cov_6_870302_g380_i0NODE_489_length_3285_cov_6_870302_g380_i0_p1_ORF_typecomplete_len616_score116_73CALCOCO1/PF07888_11/5_7e06Golgin_A5/PF09787_9/0_00035HOOK/PF05622_12/0_00066DUF812/PF05667_11/0_0014Myosin_tail_1/PF01576_19/0_0026AAA_13/PF13166_6/0_012MAD/PF05557_13/0_014Macoilin/PF09726_9/0_045VPS38/PF17649_1/0_078AIP3/PF03915_13/7_2e02AIP3/PF03915_13/3e03AIP3/PF03915_13/0_95AIP3/PF03915_1